MKQRYMKLTALLLFVGIFFTGCKKYLDVVPSEFTTEADLLNDVKQAEKELAVLYSRLPVDYWTPSDDPANMVYEGLSDAAYPNWSYSVFPLVIGGQWSAANNPLSNYTSAYQNIRIAFHFLNTIDKATIKQADQIDEYKNRLIPRYKLEAKFLMSLYYFELMKRFGTVPLVDRYLESSEIEAALATPRASVDELVAFMVKNLDESIAGLPDSYPDGEAGRITKGAALALKAKVLLYAASPMFNGGTIDGQDVLVDGNNFKTNVLAISNADGKKLFNQQYDNEKWKKAADAAKATIDWSISNGYTLSTDRQKLFTTITHKEFLFHKQMGSSSSFEYGTTPNGGDYGGWGGLSPTQEFVDSYETGNGLPKDDDPSYTEAGYFDTTLKAWRSNAFVNVPTTLRNMYRNRDPRFYTDVFFDGQPYLHRNVYMQYRNDGNSNSDGFNSLKPGNSSYTGYYVKKWNDETNHMNGTKHPNARNYPYFRLADVYLWYAEATNEYLSAPNNEVYDAINKVRARVGMPSLPVAGYAPDNTKAGMRKRIQNERKVELFAEGQRYWDMRRWLISHLPQNKTITGLSVQKKGDEFFVRTPVLASGRVFRVGDYLMPIPAQEINKAPGVLVQNFSW